MWNKPWAYWAYLGVADLALVALLFLEPGNLTQVLVARAAGVAAIVAMYVLVRSIDGPMRPVWYTFWAYLLCTVLGDILYDRQMLTREDVPSPGLSDGIYLACYVFAFVGLAWLNRITEPQANRIALLDSIVIGLALLAAVGFFVIAPQMAHADLSDPGFLVSTAYPVLDVFVLAAMIRGFLVPCRRSPALLAVTGAMFCFLVLDLIYNFASASGITLDTEVPWLAAIALLALSPALRGASEVSAVPAAESRRITPLRALVVAVASLTAPALVILDTVLGDGVASVWLSVTGIVIFALVLMRAYHLLRDGQRAGA